MNNSVVRPSTTNLAYDYSHSFSESSYPKPVLGKYEDKIADDKPVKNGNTTVKGVLPLQSSRKINNTNYIIERTFSGLKTPAMLIEERVLTENRNTLSPYISSSVSGVQNNSQVKN